MAKGQFHIGVNGVKPCSATVRACRYQDFDTEEEAQSTFENQRGKIDGVVKTIESQEVFQERADEIAQVIKNSHIPPPGIMSSDLMESHKSFEEWQKSREAAYIKSGEMIASLAEKIGAPSDEEFSTIVNQRLSEKLAETELLKGQYDRLSKKVIDYRESISQEKGGGWFELIDKGELTKEQIEQEELLRRQSRKALKAYSEITSWSLRGKHIESADLYQQRSDAYKKVLEGVGVEFAKRGDLNVEKGSHSNATKLLAEASTFYPKVWVEQSNNFEKPFIALMTEGRAHYSPKPKHQKRYEVKDQINFEQYPKGYQLDLKREENLGAYPITTDPNSQKSPEVREGNILWAIPKNEIVDDENRPEGRGWRQEEIYDEIYDSEGFLEVVGTRKVWVRPKRKRQEISKELHELTISDKPNYAGLPRGTSVALHEFAHRMENVNQRITTLEHSFLSRRGSGCKLEKINGMEDEVGYRDGFPNHYMGKVYEGGSTEILSMGMESIFSGTNGGLSGNHNNKADAEYKHFILGMLASSILDERG